MAGSAQLLERLGALRDMLAPARLTEIVDVGANPTERPLYMPLVDAKTARVTGFEPQKSAFDALGPQQGPHERYLPYAVGDGGTATLHVCRSGGFTSLLTPNPEIADYISKPRWRRFLEVTETVEMETRKLDEIDEITHVDMLKIDIQGGEVAVFESGADRLSRALCVVTEASFVPIYKDQPLFDAQMRTLGGFGLRFHSFATMKAAPLSDAGTYKLPIERDRQQMIDGDAIFVRDPVDMGAMDDEQLKHLALIAAGALQMPDLLARCLGALRDRGGVTADQMEQCLTAYRGVPA